MQHPPVDPRPQDATSPAATSLPAAPGRMAWHRSPRVIAAMAAICVTGALVAVGVQQGLLRTAPQSPREIVARNAAAVVQIHTQWSLLDPATQKPLHQRRGSVRLGQGVMPDVPFYIRTTDGLVVPWIVAGATDASIPIEQALTGSGFLASADGRVITNRHVATPWMEPFEGEAGALFEIHDGQARLVGTSDGRTQWIPGRDGFGQGGQGPTVLHRHAVRFENGAQAVEAQVDSTSGRHDVSVMRLIRPPVVQPVALDARDGAIRRGDRVVVLGYPAVAGPGQTAVTLSEGAVGNILRQPATPGAASAVNTGAPLGDVYQLTINSTGGGNSGGPVFNDRGEVVAIFFAGRELAGARVTFAVPIRYAKELLDGKVAWR